MIRLIPACAGKTNLVWLKVLAWWDHPRVSREDEIRMSLDVNDCGSSLLARGKLLDLRLYQGKRLDFGN